MQLLAKAGWKGGGLGAQEQGITMPVAAWHQKGRRGIGAASGKQQQQQPEPGAIKAATAASAQPAPGASQLLQEPIKRFNAV